MLSLDLQGSRYLILLHACTPRHTAAQAGWWGEIFSTGVTGELADWESQNGNQPASDWSMYPAARTRNRLRPIMRDGAIAPSSGPGPSFFPPFQFFFVRSSLIRALITIPLRPVTLDGWLTPSDLAHSDPGLSNSSGKPFRLLNA